MHSLSEYLLFLILYWWPFFLIMTYFGFELSQIRLQLVILFFIFHFVFIIDNVIIGKLFQLFFQFDVVSEILSQLGFQFLFFCITLGNLYFHFDPFVLFINQHFVILISQTWSILIRYCISRNFALWRRNWFNNRWRYALLRGWAEQIRLYLILPSTFLSQIILCSL